MKTILRTITVKISFSILMALVVLIAPNLLLSQLNKGLDNPIKIGLLIPDDNYIEARFSAEIAVREINKKGGINGRLFQLVTRSMKGSWGTGSKEAVDLVFKEKVWALMGAHDGRNAHLVEQIIAKTHIVFLSVWTSDPTLSQAFVPWYFSCVPNDIQQAKILVEDIYNNKKLTRIVTVSDENYDSKLALQSFLKEIKIKGKTVPKQLYYDNVSTNFQKLLDMMHKNAIQGIVTFGKPSSSLHFIQQLRQRKIDQPIFATLSLLGESKFENIEAEDYDNVTVVTPGNWFRSKTLPFQDEFQKKYERKPGAVAAYAFDGMNVIIEAIRHSGIDREKIQEAMSKTQYRGVTGPIQFDNKGNRIGAAELIKINNRISVSVKK